MLTQLILLSWGPPKKSAVTSFSCSSWICRDFTWHQNISALLEPESSSLPGGSPGRLYPRAKVSCLLLWILSKADVHSAVAVQILSACGWLCNTAYAPQDPCIYIKIKITCHRCPYSLSSSWRLLGYIQGGHSGPGASGSFVVSLLEAL